MINNKQFTTNDLKAYCNTLKTDPDTQQKFIAIPVEDYVDLSHLRYYLINAINLLSEVETSPKFNHEEFGFTLKTLTHFLRHTTMNIESEGLDKMFKS
tara:strand:+ start:1384 stop:1677 length:294 start_codon:yes stop_codon:yes gene_type:complete